MLKRNRSFRSLILGRYCSNIGDSIYNIVLSWHIMQITDDSFWVGIFNAALFIPNILSFLFGNYIDNHSKKKLLIILAAGQCFSVVFIIITMVLNFSFPALICFLVLLASIFGVNTYTVQDAYIPFIVKKSELEEAARIKSISYKVSDYIFNAISGFLLEFLSATILLVVSATSLLISSLVFLNMEEAAEERKNKIPEKKESIFAGFYYLVNNKIMLIFTISSIFLNFFFSGFNVYIVLIANSQKSSFLLGMINSGISIGAFLGTWIFAGHILKKTPAGKKLIIAMILFGLGLMISGLFTNSWWYVFAIAVAGLFLGILHVTNDPIMQVVLPKDSLGKALSAYYSLAVGVMPIGSLVFGYLANYLSPGYFMLIFGMVYLLFGVTYFCYKPLRHFRIEDN